MSNNYYGLKFNGQINLHLENLTKSTGVVDVKWKRLDSLNQYINFI